MTLHFPTPFSPDVSVVVIGRNEGKRLQRCLLSIRAANWGTLQHEVIYVDSHSSDGSPLMAATLGASVCNLGQGRMCAAVARNIGWRQARGTYILFLDGDTQLHPDFIQSALPYVLDPAVCAAWGHRRESHPRQSIYTEVLDLDWVYATGRVEYFGGDALVRRQALEEVGGFDETLVAGEEPELCRRLREQGWQIEHIDAPMTLHDLAIVDWRAYWRRAERTGLAFAQVADRFARSSDPFWSDLARRNKIHVGVMAAWLLGLVVALWQAPWFVLPWLLLPVVMCWRSARRGQWKCPNDTVLAFKYAVHSHLQQIPILAGQWHWHRLARQQRQPELMEYKRPATNSQGRGQA